MADEAHWNQAYLSKKPTEVSWYEASPGHSLELIGRLCSPSGRIVDIGGGASLLVDALLAAGYERPIVLDVSASGLDISKSRLGSRCSQVEWIVGDITKIDALPAVDLWHDRALLHFLTNAVDQRAYARLAARTVRAGGHLVAATFAPDGPQRCSGLPVQRHDGASVAALLGDDFELIEEQRAIHRTPAGVEQRFCWTVLRRR